MSNEVPGAVDGLIFGFALDGRRGGHALTWDDVPGLGPESEPWWLHMDFTVPRVRKWLRRESGLSRYIVEALLDDDSRPRFLQHDDGLLVILRGVNTNPGADPEDMVSIRLWLTPRYVISTRRRRLLSAQDLRDSFDVGKGPKDTGDLLVKLVTRLGNRIEPAVERLDEQIELAESRFEAGKAMAYGGEFATLRRQSARLRRYLVPQRDALERLSRITDGVLAPQYCEALREEANQMTRYLEDLDLVRERAMVAQEELLGNLAHEQNRRVYILSIVAAIFLPLSFLTGLMGMNVAGLPGTENPSAFFLLVLMMIGAALGIVGLFKWQKWL